MERRPTCRDLLTPCLPFVCLQALQASPILLDRLLLGTFGTSEAAAAGSAQWIANWIGLTLGGAITYQALPIAVHRRDSPLVAYLTLANVAGSLLIGLVPLAAAWFSPDLVALLHRDSRIAGAESRLLAYHLSALPAAFVASALQATLAGTGRYRGLIVAQLFALTGTYSTAVLMGGLGVRGDDALGLSRLAGQVVNALVSLASLKISFLVESFRSARGRGLHDGWSHLDRAWRNGFRSSCQSLFGSGGFFIYSAIVLPSLGAESQLASGIILSIYVGILCIPVVALLRASELAMSNHMGDDSPDDAVAVGRRAVSIAAGLGVLNALIISAVPEDLLFQVFGGRGGSLDPAGALDALDQMKRVCSLFALLDAIAVVLTGVLRVLDLGYLGASTAGLATAYAVTELALPSLFCTASVTSASAIFLTYMIFLTAAFLIRFHALSGRQR